MRFPLLELAHVGVSIPVDDFYPLSPAGVSQKMTVGRLVSTAEHDHKGPTVEVGRDSFAQVPLVRLHVAGNLQVSQIASVAEQVHEAGGTGIGDEMVECRAQRLRPRGRADPPAVAPYAFVGRKAQQEGSRSAASA